MQVEILGTGASYGHFASITKAGTSTGVSRGELTLERYHLWCAVAVAVFVLSRTESRCIVYCLRYPYRDSIGGACESDHESVY